MQSEEYTVSFENADAYKLDLPERDEFGTVIQTEFYNGICIGDDVMYSDDKEYAGKVRYFFQYEPTELRQFDYGVCARLVYGFDVADELEKVDPNVTIYDDSEPSGN